MVQATSGAGGPSLRIRGSMDTSNIDRGFSRVKSGLSSVQGEAKGFTSGLQRMSGVASGLASKMGNLATAGAGAMTALATKAPAVAPALAKMQVSMQKLSFAAGRALQPAFEGVAGFLDKFANWADSHPKIFSGLLTTLGGIAALKFSGVLGLLSSLASTTVGGTVLTALGYIAAIGGVAAAGAAGTEFAMKKGKEYVGMTGEDYKGDQSGQTLLRRLPQQVWADITGQKTPWEKQQEEDVIWQNAVERAKEGKLSGTEGKGTVQQSPDFMDDRRWFLLEYWDSLWG